MKRLPLELEKQILAAPGTRIGRAVGAWFEPSEPQPVFADEKQFMAAVIAEAKRWCSSRCPLVRKVYSTF